MSFQEALEEGDTDYFQETKEEIWEYIRSYSIYRQDTT